MKKKQIDLARVEHLAALGLSNAKIARFLNISERTFYDDKRASADFADAYARGRVRNEQELSEALDRIITADKEEVSTEARLKAIMFKLERLHGWTKTEKHDLVSSDGSMSPQAATVDLSRFTAEEIIEMGKAVFRGE